MLVDWFTVAAQIVNFLILIGLLKWLLYDRVIRAMDERKERIASTFRQAREQQDQAENEAEEYRHKQQEIQQQREEILQEARDKARQQREELTSQARKEVQEQRSNWIDSLQTQQSSFLDSLRRQAGSRICSIARQVLTDLAQQDLQRQVVSVFRDRIANLQADESQKVSEALSNRRPLTLRTARPLEDEDRRPLLQTVREQLEVEDIQEETDEELICGLELQADGWALRWNVDEYLEELTDRVQVEIDQQIRRHSQGRESSDSGDKETSGQEASENPSPEEDDEEAASQ